MLYRFAGGKNQTEIILLAYVDVSLYSYIQRKGINLSNNTYFQRKVRRHATIESEAGDSGEVRPSELGVDAVAAQDQGDEEPNGWGELVENWGIMIGQPSVCMSPSVT